jgi:hypothetical protein
MCARHTAPDVARPPAKLRIVSVSGSYLLILGDRQGIAWVLREQRMAFPARSRVEVNRLAVGDELLIYTTRGAYRKPTRDRGRVIGTATVTSAVERLDDPVEFGGRSFPHGCDLLVESLVAWGGGVELQPLIDRLAAFPNSKTWSIQLRRPLLRLPAQDAALLRSRLAPEADSRSDHLDGYLAHDHPPMPHRSQPASTHHDG